MDKGGKGKKKSITITKTPYASKLVGKNFYIRSKSSLLYLDCNFTGDALISEERQDRELFTKWFFQGTDTPGIYFLKNMKTELYLTSNEYGDIYNTSFDEQSGCQKWIVLSSSEAESYIIINNGNSFCLICDNLNRLTISKIIESKYEEASDDILFKIFQFKGKK